MCAAISASQGAIAGAASGAVSGAAVGAVVSAVQHRVSTGSWKGAGKAAASGAKQGAINGAFTGAITGAVSGALHPTACFVAGTSVAVASGYVAIETLQPGDLVWAWDKETGDVALKAVKQVFVNESDELIHLTANGKEITTTPTHPFYVAHKGWYAAVDLRAGDILVLVNGEYVTLEKTQHEILEAPITVYNFEVEDYHTYYVGTDGVLVHNACDGTWASGGRPSGLDNAQTHYAKHGTEVGARNLEDYMTKAKNFANTVLQKRIKGTWVEGTTSGTYRYRYNKKYIDLAKRGANYLIVSFGAQ